MKQHTYILGALFCEVEMPCTVSPTPLPWTICQKRLKKRVLKTFYGFKTRGNVSKRDKNVHHLSV